MWAMNSEPGGRFVARVLRDPLASNAFESSVVVGVWDVRHRYIRCVTDVKCGITRLHRVYQSDRLLSR